MRMGEIIYFIIAAIVYVYVLILPKLHQKWIGWILAGCFTITLLYHLIFEGARWQMVPAYGLPLLMLMFMFLSKASVVRRFSRFAIVKVAIGIPAIMYFVIALLIPIVLPVFYFVPPSGPYPEGKVSYHFIDDSRQEIWTDIPNDPRELMVTIWYPALTPQKSSQHALYIDRLPKMGNAFSKQYGIPEFLFSHLPLVKTNAYFRPAVSEREKDYPVVLFLHGFPGMREMNTFQVEELASQGYIVVGIDHPYNSIATVFPDGRVALSKGNMPNLLDLTSSDNLIRDVWVPDSQYVIQQLLAINDQDPNKLLTGKLDITRFGVMGHSFGGAESVQLLLLEDRIKAGINMDGTLFGSQFPADGLRKPLLYMNTDSDRWEEGLHQPPPPNEVLENAGITLEQYDKFKLAITDRRKNIFQQEETETVTLHGAQHLSFTDYYLWSPYLAFIDKVSVREHHRIINENTVAFFDRYLKS
jgi:pimeloyl-ACP methyl ester carboxylesterase